MNVCLDSLIDGSRLLGKAKVMVVRNYNVSHSLVILMTSSLGWSTTMRMLVLLQDLYLEHLSEEVEENVNLRDLSLTYFEYFNKDEISSL